MGLTDLARALIVAGLGLAAVGGLLLLIGALGLGGLPGDLHVGRGNLHVYVPVAACVVVSILGTILLNLFLRR